MSGKEEKLSTLHCHEELPELLSGEQVVLLGDNTTEVRTTGDPFGPPILAEPMWETCGLIPLIDSYE